MGFKEEEEKTKVCLTEVERIQKKVGGKISTAATTKIVGDDDESVGQDTSIHSLLDRIDANISLGKNNIAQPLLTPSGDNKVTKKVLLDEQRDIKIPSCIKSQEVGIVTTMTSKYSSNSTITATTNTCNKNNQTNKTIINNINNQQQQQQPQFSKKTTESDNTTNVETPDGSSIDIDLC